MADDNPTPRRSTPPKRASLSPRNRMGTSAQTTSWQATAELPSYPPLKGSLQVDTAIIGGGITGLMAAYHLTQAGKRVALVEAASLGSGTTGATTAHLTASYDHDYQDLEKTHHLRTCELLAQALNYGIGLISTAVHKEGISCDFRRLDAYYYAEGDSEVNTIQREADAARRAGLSCEYTASPPLPFATQGGLRFSHQAAFHPLQFLRGLAHTVSAGGGLIFERSRVVNWSEGKPCVVNTPGGELHAEQVIMATHTPLGRNVLQTLLEPLRSHVITAKIAGQSLPDALFWDGKEPYFYIRRLHSEDGNVIVVGGCDYKTGEGNDRQAHAKLEAYARRHFVIEAITARWSAQLYEPVDQLPYIGLSPLSDHLFVGTGYSGDGMTLGALAGWMLAEQASGNKTPFDELFRPSRIRKAGVKKFLSHNLHVGKTLLKDLLPKVGKAKLDLQGLAPGEGCVGEHQGEALAIYRDADGQMHSFSAICPHMHCHLRWNAGQSSFDCPCHGSRFDTNGQIIEGPALQGLEERTLGSAASSTEPADLDDLGKAQ